MNIRAYWVVAFAIASFLPFAVTLPTYALFMVMNDLLFVAALTVTISYFWLGVESLRKYTHHMNYGDYLASFIVVFSFAITGITGYSIALQLLDISPIAVMGANNPAYIGSSFFRYVGVLGCLMALGARPFLHSAVPSKINAMQVTSVVLLGVALALMQLILFAA